MEVEVTRVDAELARQLAVRERIVSVRPERLEDPEAERMAECLQLIGAVEHQDVEQRGLFCGRHGCLYIRFGRPSAMRRTLRRRRQRAYGRLQSGSGWTAWPWPAGARMPARPLLPWPRRSRETALPERSRARAPSSSPGRPTGRASARRGSRSVPAPRASAA